MRETKAIIERVRRTGDRWQHLELVVEAGLEQIQPGQILLARTEGFWSSYLREQWVPIGVDEDNGFLLVERPIAHTYTPSDAVSVIGPVGSPFPLKRGIRHLLLVALDYPPTRLLFLILEAVRQHAEVALVLTGQAQHYPLGTLPKAVEVVYSPDPMSWQNQDKTLIWADQVFAIAPPVYSAVYFHTLLETSKLARQALPEAFLQGVFDFPLPCGTGACMACMVAGRHTDRLACTDGAAFDLTQVRF